MKNTKIFLIILMFFVININMLSANLITSEKVVTVEKYLSHDKITPGLQFKIAIMIDIKKGWHISAGNIKSETAIPTQLTFESIDGLTFEASSYPAPTGKIDLAGDILPYYENKVVVGVNVRASSNLQPGNSTIVGTLRIQACDDTSCIAPADIDIKIPIIFASKGSKVNKINQEIVNQIGLAENEIARLIREEGYFTTYLLIFLMGIALCLTPCVFPMIPITLSYFSNQAEQKMAKTFFLALVYVLGLAIVYSTLGTIAALTGGVFGAHMSQWYVILPFIIIMLALTLNMFGLYEIVIPSSLTSKLGGSKSGFVGTFLMGLALGVFIAPCVGAVVGILLLFVMQTQDVFMGFSMFFTLSIGLGVPFILLAIFSGAIKKLPSSGVWMVGVKKIFGFLMLLAILFFSKPYISKELFLSLETALGIIAFVYLVFFESSGKKIKTFNKIKNVIALLFLIFGLWTGYNFGSDLLFPPKGIEWTVYKEELVSKAKDNKKAIIIDFTANWCISCAEMDEEVFHNPKVYDFYEKTFSKGEQEGKIQFMKVDLSNEGSDPRLKKITKKYDISGLPTILFIDEKGSERTDLRVFGIKIDAEEFLKRAKQLLNEKNEYEE